jgi:hypothetical protein
VLHGKPWRLAPGSPTPGNAPARSLVVSAAPQSVMWASMPLTSGFKERLDAIGSRAQMHEFPSTAPAASAKREKPDHCRPR